MPEPGTREHGIDQIERVLRAHNMGRHAALALIRRIGPHRHAWSRDLFEQARQRTDALYLTAAKLWRPGRETLQRHVR